MMMLLKLDKPFEQIQNQFVQRVFVLYRVEAEKLLLIPN